VQIETCTPKFIVKTMIEHEGNIDLTSQTYVGHANLPLTSSQSTRFVTSIGDIVRNPLLWSIEVSQWYTNAVREQEIVLGAWCAMLAMKTIVGMIYSSLKCRHVECLSFSGLDQTWRFPHTTNYESGWSSLHSWQRD